jgi:DNA-binding GntR family transcriptional regulator
MNLSGAVEFMSKRSLVEDAIKRAIHEGGFAPGQKLNLDEIARQLKVSRTPVREAFRRLELEGYLKVEPCVGTIVVGLEPQEVIEVYTIRINLEGLATRLAVPRIDAERVAALEESVRAIAGLRVDEDYYARIEVLNRGFHYGIYNQSGNFRLLRIIESLWDNVVRYRAQISYVAGSEQSNLEHLAILGAIRARNAEQAERLMQEHLERSYRSLLAYLQADKKERQAAVAAASA